MKTVEDYNFSHKKALIRVDFNVPLDKSLQVTDGTRITAAYPTIKKILDEQGAVILMSHLGRPKDGAEDKYSLKHIIPTLKNLFKKEIKFASDCIGDDAIKLAQDLKPGEILLLENLRFYKEEEKGDATFAKKLAQLGDIYVNDAFGTAHRAHASTAVIAQYFQDKCFGYLMESEIKNAQKVLEKAEKPFTAIMGGAKISDKILLIEKLLDKIDNLLIGGGMSYTFFKAMGGNIGKSLVEEDKLEIAKNLIKLAKEKNVNLLLPQDSIIANAFSNDAQIQEADNMQIAPNWLGLDIGPKAIESFTNVIKKSKTILWNGPMGVFEMSNFSKGTAAIAQAITEATEAGAFSLIGGGDSAAAIAQLGLSDKVSYVSTGGGALLEYMEGKELPGITAILQD